MTLRTEINFEQDKNYKPVLDQGFVGLVDHMGSDQSIVRAARVSYGEGTKTVLDDRNLIRYLMRHEHTTPFEMCELVFHIKLPIFVMRQLVRHRTASMNEYSARYSLVTDEFYIPNGENIMPQSKDNKQGRSGEMDATLKLAIQGDMKNIWDEAFKTYKLHLDSYNLARETARSVLPVGSYTECYWKANLKNFLHMIRLRADSHAQWEIREYANAMYELAKPLFPLAIEAFEDYQVNSVKFSAGEFALLQNLLTEKKDIEPFIEEHGGEKHVAQLFNLSLRELREFASKVR